VTLLDIDQHKTWCSVYVTRGRRGEVPCARTPVVREWTEVLGPNDTSDLVIYPVCMFHYNRHLADGVINQLGKLLG
jgi:hypothetical protein